MSTESTPTTEPIRLPGHILRSARELKGLTIAEMAAISNLTRQVIIGIEEDQYDNLHGLSFVRGYLKLYAKKLGVEEAQVLEPFDAWKSQVESQPARAFSGFQEKGSNVSAKPVIPKHVLVGAAIVLILGVFGVVISGDRADEDTATKKGLVKQQQNLAIDDETVIPSEASDKIQSAMINDSDRSIGFSPITEETDRQGFMSDSRELSQRGEVQSDNEILIGSEQNLGPVDQDSVTIEDMPKVISRETPNDNQIVLVSPRELARKNEEASNRLTTQRRKQQTEERNVIESESELREIAPQPRALIQSNGTTVTSTPPVAEAGSSTQNTQVASSGRVIAEASGLQRAPLQSVETTQVSPSDDMGARVISQTVTGPDEAMLAMGERGKLQMEFSGESWVEVRDARGRLVLADLMQADQSIRLDTFGPVEVLIGAVSASTVRFNGALQNLTPKAFQDVARVTLGSDE